MSRRGGEARSPRDLSGSCSAGELARRDPGETTTIQAAAGRVALTRWKLASRATAVAAVAAPPGEALFRLVDLHEHESLLHRRAAALPAAGWDGPNVAELLAGVQAAHVD